jgi:hypothetical protein
VVAKPRNDAKIAGNYGIVRDLLTKGERADENAEPSGLRAVLTGASL